MDTISIAFCCFFGATFICLNVLVGRIERLEDSTRHLIDALERVTIILEKIAGTEKENNNGHRK